LNQPEAFLPTHIFSIAEAKILELCKENEATRTALLEHNKKFFMRAYPAGWRVDSSNPDPSMFWRKGVQMVALNWQNFDEGMVINNAFFSGTGGWVLKPPELLDWPAYKSVEADTASSCTGNDDGKNDGLTAQKSHEPEPGHLERAPALNGALPSESARAAEAKAARQRMAAIKKGAGKLFDLRITLLAGQHIPRPKKEENLKARVVIKICADAPPLGDWKEGDWKKKSETRKGSDPDFKKEVLEFKAVSERDEVKSFVRYVAKVSLSLTVGLSLTYSTGSRSNMTKCVIPL
jgi:hypothetical protein